MGKRRFILHDKRFHELLAKKLSDTAIARELGVSRCVISYNRRKLGIPANFKGGRGHAIPEEKFRKVYDTGASYVEVAKILGCSKNTVFALKRKFGYPYTPRIRINQTQVKDWHSDSIDGVQFKFSEEYQEMRNRRKKINDLSEELERVKSQYGVFDNRYMRVRDELERLVDEDRKAAREVFSHPNRYIRIEAVKPLHTESGL